jgi:hypothetical protein
MSQTPRRNASIKWGMSVLAPASPTPGSEGIVGLSHRESLARQLDALLKRIAEDGSLDEDTRLLRTRPRRSPRGLSKSTNRQARSAAHCWMPSRGLALPRPGLAVRSLTL